MADLNLTTSFSYVPEAAIPEDVLGGSNGGLTIWPKELFAPQPNNQLLALEPAAAPASEPK